MSGLENLDSLDKCLYVETNLSLTSLDALTGLKSIGTCVNWQYPAESSVLSLNGNPALSSIDGLANSTFQYFNQWGKMVITNCPNLSACELKPVCTHLESGKPATVSGNAPGCNSVAKVVAACVVSIEEIPEGEPAIRFSPNPAGDFLHIQIDGNDQWDIRLFDFRGRLLYRQTITGSQTVPLNDWPAGLYTLRAATGGRVYTGRLVKL